MRLLVTGATGFLGWRTATLLAERGHEVIALARPGHRPRAASADLDAVEADAGAPATRDLVAGCDAVLHYAGVPDPAGARADPARAVRENAGTTLNLLEAREPVANVAAETITVGDVAALAEGREPAGGATWTVASPFRYEHDVASYLRSAA